MIANHQIYKGMKNVDNWVPDSKAGGARVWMG